MAIYYSQLDKVMSPDDASTVISKAAERGSPQGTLGRTSFPEKLGKDFKRQKFLKGCQTPFLMILNLLYAIFSFCLSLIMITVLVTINTL